MGTEAANKVQTWKREKKKRKRREKKKKKKKKLANNNKLNITTLHSIITNTKEYDKIQSMKYI